MKTNETTIEWVLEHYPERVKALLDALDLDRAGWKRVSDLLGEPLPVAGGFAELTLAPLAIPILIAEGRP